MKNQIIASIGLISDTHYQDRLFNLPPGLADVWTNIDLILHAGDIGDLSVLNLLSKFAPVIAVHGNDEPDDVLKELPYQQIVAIRGTDILLWQSHYPDPEEEKSKRKGAWGPKLERIAVRGCERQTKCT
jgi:putative phosphoesterase